MGSSPSRAPLVALATAGLLACSPKPETETMSGVAERYVKLVLALGRSDADYVDAYYGPQEWREEAQGRRLSLTGIAAEADALLARLATLAPAAGDEMLALRHRYLERQLQSLRARADMLAGAQLPFDEEARALYDATPPHYEEGHFRQILEELGAMLPGDGPLAERYAAFQRDFVVPPERLDAVFRAAIDACRERTAARVELPADESFAVEYVTGKSWSGYNWYQGDFRSLIQVNTDLPIHIDRAVDLAGHEGYPGHHVYNVLLEKEMVRGRGWVEFSVYPLFSPQSLIAEGSANYGVEIVLPGAERLELERQLLFPLAGLDTARVDEYYQVQSLRSRLDYAGNEAARAYLDGTFDAAEAARWLVDFAMMTPGGAERRVRFFDQYRTYVINYNLGKDLVARHVQSLAGDDPDRAWEVFGELLASPRLPSGLQGGERIDP